MSGQRFYDDQEAQEILRMAARHDIAGGAMSREMLVKTAQELGISPEALEAAEAQYVRQQGVEREEKEFQAQRRRSFYSDLVSYVLVNGFLLGINWMTGPGHWWVIYPALGWGLGLAFHAYATFFVGSEDYQEEFEKWRSQRHGGTVTEVDPIIAESIERNGADAKLMVIKDVREVAGMSLHDAKAAVDQYYQRLGR